MREALGDATKVAPRLAVGGCLARHTSYIYEDVATKTCTTRELDKFAHAFRLVYMYS